MSVRHQSQKHAGSTYTPVGGGHLLLHRAVVASTSLLAISAALGWNPALAAGTCGTPDGSGVVNCNATAYPAGIEYLGADSVDDLTLNVGTFAGQSGAVTVGGPGIVVESTPFADPTTSETVNVGANVSISSAVSNGITTVSTAYQAAYAGAQATASSTVTNQGSVSTTGDYGQGIYAAAVSQSIAGFFYSSASGSYATISNAGAITTSGVQASGINAFSQAIAGVTPAPSGAYYGTAKAVSVVNNSGNITTTGAPGGAFGSDGIYAGAYAVAGGIYGARGTATVDVTNTGTISTSGDLGNGIQANAQAVGESYTGFATGGAYVSVTNGGNITTQGAGAAGISATTLAIGNTGDKSYAYSESTVVNAGGISTAGAGSDGISVQAKGASYGYFASVYTLADVTNTGSISTTGDGAMGIYALAGSQAVGLLSAPYANAKVVNTGAIKTKGKGSIGILAVSSTSAPGTFVYSAARTTVTNAGSVSTSGDGAVGIYALAQSSAASAAGIGSDSNGKTYAATTLTNAGSVTTQGVGAVGSVAMSTATSYSVYYARATALTTATNAGVIMTSGAGAHGLVSQATATAVTPATSIYQSLAKANSTVTNIGTITVSGAYSNGIIATSGATAVGTTAGASATATTMVTNAGAITASGIGIEAYAGAYASSGAGAVASATTTVANAGSVTSTGAGGVGVLAASVGATNTGAVATHSTLVNTAGASIVASGAGGVGAKVEGAYSTLVTYAGSTISGGTGAGAVGVYTNAAEGIVSNAGTITSGNDAALSMTALAANIVKNTGTITGTVTLHTGAGGQNVLYNYGTWNAVGGDSDFTHGAGGGSNLANEAGGTIVVMGSQSFTGLDKFTNLGTVDMTKSPGFETLTVSGDYEGIGGILKVDASTQGGMQGDELVIQGAASGSTKVKPTIVGTPGQTTGNGILLVSAASGASAGEFTISGNASNGSEVAGAFEYNLDFVPGTGTAGDWYLQSQVYPGVYQFGQIESSTLTISDQVNPELNDLMNQAFNSSQQTASLTDTSQQVASTDNSFVPSANASGLSGWGRFNESRFNIDPSGSSAANYKLRVDAAQFGIDDNWHDGNNLVMFGGYVTPFNAFTDFNTLDGHIDSKGTAYGIYGLWFSGPWQAGIRLNYDANTARFTDKTLGTDASVKPNEEGVQIAASYDMPLDWADFTPSGEFNYGTVKGVHFTDGAGDLVQLGSTDDVWGKLNGRFSWNVTTDHGLLVQPYVNIGLLYRGDTDTSTKIGAFSTSTNVNGFDGDFSVGVNTNLAAGLSLSAQAGYVAGDRINGWTGFLGLRYTPGAVETPAPAPAPAMAPPPPPPPPPPATKTFIVFFDFNKSNLTTEAESVVSEAVKASKETGMVRVLVTGHTDTVGSDSYNMGLSVRRAQSVKDEMVREGIDGSGISIEGKGFHDPLVPTGPGVREPQNRRAVIDLGG